MRPDRDNDHTNEQAPTIAGTTLVELIAVLTVLVFVLGAAAALLLVTPHSADPAPRANPAVVSQAEAATPPERPFHERYPVNATGEPVDPPTF
jgi:hypothetical protein